MTLIGIGLAGIGGYLVSTAVLTGGKRRGLLGAIAVYAAGLILGAA